MKPSWEKQTSKESLWYVLGGWPGIFFYLLLMAFEAFPWTRFRETPKDPPQERQLQIESSRASKRLTPHEQALKELLFYKPGEMTIVRIGSIIYSRDADGDIWVEHVIIGEREKMPVWDSIHP